MAARSSRGAGPAPGPGARHGATRRPHQPAPSARRTSRVEPEAAAPTGRRRTSRFTSRALVLLLVVAVLSVSYASSIRAWLNQREEQRSLSAQIASQRAQIAELRTAKARWQDPAYIEDQARLRFGWVMPGERSYRVIGKNGTVLSAGPSQRLVTTSATSAASAPWWEGAVSSLLQAGKPAVTTHAPARRPARRIRPDPGTSAGR